MPPATTPDGLPGSASSARRPPMAAPPTAALAPWPRKNAATARRNTPPSAPAMPTGGPGAAASSAMRRRRGWRAASPVRADTARTRARIFPKDLRGDALRYFLDCLNTAQNNGHMAAGVLGRNVDRRRRSRTKVRRKLKKSAFALMTDCGGRIKDGYFISKSQWVSRLFRIFHCLRRRKNVRLRRRKNVPGVTP